LPVSGRAAARAGGKLGRATMAKIVIKDLKESVELDRQAMREITGGSTLQRRSSISGYQSPFFQKPTSFDYFQLPTVDFNLNKF
jgi:hypothetical protein